MPTRPQVHSKRDPDEAYDGLEDEPSVFPGDQDEGVGEEENGGKPLLFFEEDREEGEGEGWEG